MKKSDFVSAIIAFALIVLMFGAIGGVDSGRLDLWRGIAIVLGLTALLAADVFVHDMLVRHRKK